MKKVTILFFLMSLVFMVFGQSGSPMDSVNFRQYGDRYYFPEVIRSGCMEANLDPISTPYRGSPSISCYSLVNVIDDSLLCVRGLPVVNSMLDFAQQFTTGGQSIEVAGLAALTSVQGDRGGDCNNLDSSFYFKYEIRDASLTNVLASVDIVPNVTTAHLWEPCDGHYSGFYTELFFDSTITLSEDFYLVMHSPDTCLSWSEGRPYISIFLLGDSCSRVECERYPSPLYRNSGGQWMSYSYYMPNVKHLYFFPILADSTSGLSDKDMSSYTRIYPNPVSERVNINCSYKIKHLQLYNEIGVLLQEHRPDSYNTVLDLRDYPKGVYIVNITTSKGKTSQKVIRQ